MNLSGYKEWIDNAEINIDYYSAFLKAWIAFNAWYNYEINEKTDQQCIEKICEDSRFKSYITNLLASEDSEAKTYRDNIAKLHEALMNSPLKSQEYFGIKQDISFSQIAVKNKSSDNHFEHRGVKYKCSKCKAKILTVVTDTRSSNDLLNYEQDAWDIEELKQQTDFKMLTSERRSKCEELYKVMVPYIVSSVIYTESKESKGKKIGAYLFVNDNDRIAAAIIQILYMLRCCLAHGDITPDKKTSDVYRYAYEVLLCPLKKLK